MRLGGVSTLVAVSLVAAVPAVPAVANASPDAVVHSNSVRHDSGPDELLDRHAHGRRAVELLGDDLPIAAKRNDMSKRRLTRILTEDPSAWLDQAGQMFYADPSAPALPLSAPAAAAPVADPAYPLSSTFALHSKPWVTRTVFLDFDGADVVGTGWNASGLRAGHFAGFSNDSDPAFDDAERAVVQEVWSRVSEDFAPFEVDVTTADPGGTTSTKTSQLDESFGVRVLITDSAEALDDVCNGSCSGMAYLNVFDRLPAPGEETTYDLAWAFPNRVLERRASGIADTVSHEAGHTLGLEHDGLSGSEYYPDPRYAPGFWGPVMGAAWVPLTQFSNGDYPGASNLQDDVDVIDRHDAAVMSDDHGDGIGDATRLPPAPSLQTSGTIGSRVDRDVFAVTCGGVVQLDAEPAPVGPNLDLSLRLLDASGAEVRAASPMTSAAGEWPNQVVTGQDAHLAMAALPTGSYFVEVDGTGGPGYSDYGSLGQFSLAVSGCDEGPTSASSPSRPQHLEARPAADPGSVTLRWRAPAYDGGSTVTGYRVSLPGRPDLQLPAATTSTTLTDLLHRSERHFTVRAVNGTGAGLPATIDRTSTPIPVAPPLDVQLTSPADQPGTVHLSWTEPDDLNGHTSVSRYQVHRQGFDAYDIAGSAQDTVTADQRSYDFDFLKDGREYTFGVWADDEKYQPGFAATISLTYRKPPGIAATGLVASSTALDGEVVLAWTPPAAPPGTFDNYEVVRTGEDLFGTTTTSRTVPVGTNQTLFYFAVPGRSYTYAVRPVTHTVGLGETATLTQTYFGPDDGNPPPPPPTATATAAGDRTQRPADRQGSIGRRRREGHGDRPVERTGEHRRQTDHRVPGHREQDELHGPGRRPPDVHSGRVGAQQASDPGARKVPVHRRCGEPGGNQQDVEQVEPGHRPVTDVAQRQRLGT